MFFFVVYNVMLCYAMVCYGTSYCHPGFASSAGGTPLARANSLSARAAGSSTGGQTGQAR